MGLETRRSVEFEIRRSPPWFKVAVLRPGRAGRSGPPFTLECWTAELNAFGILDDAPPCTPRSAVLPVPHGPSRDHSGVETSTLGCSFDVVIDICRFSTFDSSTFERATLHAPDMVDLLHIRSRFWGRLGFDGSCDGVVACPGSGALAKPTGKLIVANTDMALAA